MRIFTFTIGLLLFSSVLHASDTKQCYADATTRSEMNSCASNDYKTVDKELNRVYQEILEAYKNDPVFLAQLKEAQRAWIKLRDLDTKLKFPPREHHRAHYGGHYSMCVLGSKLNITKQRINFLKQWLGQGVEGDVCNGSRLTKAQYESATNQ